jgi:outer membrane protein assembly factor BamB
VAAHVPQRTALGGLLSARSNSISATHLIALLAAVLVACGGSSSSDSGESGDGSTAVSYQIDAAHSGASSQRLNFLSSAPTWRRTLNGTVSHPLIASGSVYVLVSSNGQSALQALDLRTGALRWGPISVPGSFPAAGHAYGNGRVFVVTSDGELIAYEAASGDRAWRARLTASRTTARPTASGGRVFVDAGSDVQAFDQRSGTQLWSVPVQGGDGGPPAVADDRVIVSYPCQVYALRVADGAPAWHVDERCVGGGGNTVVHAAGNVYVRGSSLSPLPEVQVRSASTGSLLAARTFGGGVPPMSPAATAEAVFIVSDGRLQRFDPLMGNVAWTFGDGSIVMAPLVLGDRVVVASGLGRVDVVDAATGSLTWSANAEDLVLPPGERGGLPLVGMAAADGWLLVPTSGGLSAWNVAP